MFAQDLKTASAPFSYGRMRIKILVALNTAAVAVVVAAVARV